MRRTLIASAFAVIGLTARFALSSDAVRAGWPGAIRDHAHSGRLRRRPSSGTEWRMPRKRRRICAPVCAPLCPPLRPPLLVAPWRARLQLSKRKQARGTGLLERRVPHAAALGLAFSRRACQRLRCRSSGGIKMRAGLAKSSATRPVTSATVKRSPAMNGRSLEVSLTIVIA